MNCDLDEGIDDVIVEEQGRRVVETVVGAEGGQPGTEVKAVRSESHRTKRG